MSSSGSSSDEGGLDDDDGGSDDGSSDDGSSDDGAACAAQYVQCGGMDWTGPTCCEAPYMCVDLEPYYSQCQ
jgi:hypothetical protein